VKNSAGKISRRRLALLAGAALPAARPSAVAAPVQPEPPTEPAEAAEQARRRNAEDVAKVALAAGAEPAFRFEA
jgi:hypothetical protein